MIRRVRAWWWTWRYGAGARHVFSLRTHGRIVRALRIGDDLG